MLEDQGHELRRPHAENLGQDIYELRVKYNHVNYRILYFFQGQAAVVVSHGFSKEKRIPPKEIRLAVERKMKFESDPDSHTLSSIGIVYRIRVSLFEFVLTQLLVKFRLASTIIRTNQELQNNLQFYAKCENGTTTSIQGTPIALRLLHW